MQLCKAPVIKRGRDRSQDNKYSIENLSIHQVASQMLCRMLLIAIPIGNDYLRPIFVMGNDLAITCKGLIRMLLPEMHV